MRQKMRVLDTEVYRVDSDVYGNPRYVVHFLTLARDYGEAKYRANKLGGRVYRARWYGGGFVFQSYNIEKLVQQIKDLRKVLDNE